ncbi:hypothetical protein HW555_014336, partial [Spodoptera exigua]
LLCHHGSTESEILPVIHSPGLYFDPTTNIFFYNDFWKIVTHVDVNSIEPHLNEIDKLIVKSSLLCSKIEPEEYSNCRDIFNSIEVLLETNYVKAHSLSHIISKDTANRFKRALEFGGEILKFFFGTLDAEDARNYDAAIDACEKNDNEIFRLMKDNIHISPSSWKTYLARSQPLLDITKKLAKFVAEAETKVLQTTQRGYTVCLALIENFLKPYRRLSNTELRQQLLDSINLELRARIPEEDREGNVLKFLGISEEMQQRPSVESDSGTFSFSRKIQNKLRQKLQKLKSKPKHTSNKRKKTITQPDYSNENIFRRRFSNEPIANIQRRFKIVTRTLPHRSTASSYTVNLISRPTKEFTTKLNKANNQKN